MLFFLGFNPLNHLLVICSVSLLFAGKHGWVFERGGAGVIVLVSANPLSNPYIAYRTSPRRGQEPFLDHSIEWNADPTVSNVRPLSQSGARCPHVRFALGISKRVHGDWSAPIVAPPIVYTALPASGPGRQVLLAQYEHLDMLSPSSSLDAGRGRPAGGSSTKRAASLGGAAAPSRSGAAAATATSRALADSSGGVQELLLQAAEYPLLLEGSHFWASPVVADPTGEGRPKAILADSTGGIYVVGLTTSATSGGGTSSGRGRKQQRSFQVAQVPRLFVRREWVERRVQSEIGNATVAAGSVEGPSKEGGDIHDPYHSYFEYYYNDQNQKLLQGVSANAWSQESKDRQKLLERRRRQKLEHVQRLKQQQQQKQDRDVPGGESGGNEPLAGMDQVLPRKPEDDFVGDDLEYMLAKQRNFEERDIRAIDDDEEDASASEGHQQPKSSRDEPDPAQSQRRRLQQESDVAAGARDSEVDANADAAVSGGDTEGQTQSEGGDKGNGADEHPGGNEHEHGAGGNHDMEQMRDPAKKDGEDEERSLHYDDLAADGRGMMNDIVDVDKRGATDDLVGNEARGDDPKYGMYDDYYRRHGYGDDTYRGRNEWHREYYDTSHYIRVPPHVLCTPVLAEFPKLYSNTDEKEDVLFVAVSYFLDEDEYEGLTGYKRFTETDRGDETEASRGMYVASAIMAYILGESARWMGQTHLDLSTDYSAPENVTVVGTLPIQADVSKMGAFALASPTVADIDGDGNMEVLLGTSMGIVYAFDARQMLKKDKFPIQMPFPVESRVLVEDVRGDTNLEIFVSDIGGNVVCFSHVASPLWHRNLATSVGLQDVDFLGSSPIAMGDVNGDGLMDLTIAVLVQGRSFIFALNAGTGEDLPFFPIEFDPIHFPKIQDVSVHHKLSQPLLVDLHLDQSFLNDYLRRNGTKWAPRNGLPTSPGSASGLHIVYPQDQFLHIIEAGSGCSQVIPMGDTISTMVQVDDVHGTSRLDLIVSTEAGEVITLESPAPYHPLNTWTQGELRGRMNGHAHGYSASQGIYVHERSRQFIDIFGVYVPITFEIFDNRPNIQNEKDKRRYSVEIRDGVSSSRVLFRAKYEEPGVYTERFYIRYGPGFYTLHVVLQTSHGLLYEDTYHIGYNVRFMDGFGTLLWLPLLIAALPILLFGSRKSNWDDEEADNDREGHSLGILGRNLPS